MLFHTTVKLNRDPSVYSQPFIQCRKLNTNPHTHYSVTPSTQMILKENLFPTTNANLVVTLAPLRSYNSE
jgi:hypothetical protein